MLCMGGKTLCASASVKGATRRAKSSFIAVASVIQHSVSLHARPRPPPETPHQRAADACQRTRRSHDRVHPERIRVCPRALFSSEKAAANRISAIRQVKRYLSWAPRDMREPQDRGLPV